uniref:DUF38 domain-containing protein n=1 Tax=Panagrolaimus sp. ES5 TaxID=591445 RepID=A0AC34FQJ4_9BILA
MDNPMNAPTTSSVAKQTGKIVWPESPSLKQYFSLPYSIMYYMAMNPPTPEVYNKLIKSCKYFFERNPILVVERMDETSICAERYCDSTGFDNQPCCVKYNINKIKSKFWLTRELHLSAAATPNFISLLLPKLFLCEINQLTLFDKLVLFDDFKYLTSFATFVALIDVKIVFNDGKVVMLETILESIPEVEDFWYCFNEDYSMMTNATFKNILKLKNLGNLKSFSMFYCIQSTNIPQVCNLEDLSQFIKEYRNTKFWLDFCNVGDENYKNQMDALIDVIIESNVLNRMIKYDGQDEEKFEIMEGYFYVTDQEMEESDSDEDA